FTGKTDANAAVPVVEKVCLRKIGAMIDRDGANELAGAPAPELLPRGKKEGTDVVGRSCPPVLLFHEDFQRGVFLCGTRRARRGAGECGEREEKMAAGNGRGGHGGCAAQDGREDASGRVR